MNNPTEGVFPDELWKEVSPALYAEIKAGEQQAPKPELKPATNNSKALAKIAVLKQSLDFLDANEFTTFCTDHLFCIEHGLLHNPQFALGSLQHFMMELADCESYSYTILFNALLKDLEGELIPDIATSTVFFSYEGDFVSEEDETHTLEVNALAARVISASQCPAITLHKALEECGWNVPDVEDAVKALEKMQVTS